MMRQSCFKKWDTKKKSYRTVESGRWIVWERGWKTVNSEQLATSNQQPAKTSHHSFVPNSGGKSCKRVWNKKMKNGLTFLKHSW